MKFNSLFLNSAIISVFLSFGCFAQTVKFEHLGPDEGLTVGIINGTVQDKTGFLWIASPDGLYRYDGYSFRPFKHHPTDINSILDNNILSIFLDRDGMIWLGTAGGGLNRFDPVNETFTHYISNFNDSEALSNITVRGIAQDSQGNIWVTTAYGLNKLNQKTGKFTRYFHDPDNTNSPSTNDLRPIVIDSNDILYMGTDDAEGLNQFDIKNNQFTIYRHKQSNPKSISNNAVRAVYLTTDGLLYIGTDGGGLNRFDQSDGTFTRILHRNDPTIHLADERVVSILEDSRGIIWFGSIGGGISTYNRKTGEIHHYKNDPSKQGTLSHDWITAILESRSKIIWISTSGGGINKYSPLKEKFRHFKHSEKNPNSLSSNTIRAIYQDLNGDIWIGTIGGGINKFNPQTSSFKRFLNEPGNPFSLSINDVSAFWQDDPDILWVGTWRGGLNKLDLKSNKFSSYNSMESDPATISDDRIQAIIKTTNGSYWIGTENGLNRFNPETIKFKRYFSDPADQGTLSDSRIQTLFEDNERQLWVGTWNGLNRLNESTGKVTRYLFEKNKTRGINVASVISIVDAGNGFLWLGTYGGGLNYFNKSTGIIEKTYTENEGLTSNLIFGLLMDKTGNIWISTSRGLSRFNPVNESFRNYDELDGLQSSEFYWGAYFKTHEGQMLFGGLNGVNLFYPDSVYDNIHIPPLVLTAFKKFDKPVSLGQPLSELKTIELTHSENFFSFEFAALDFNNPEKNLYAYKLEGFNEDWIYCGNSRVATYTNLDGGEYTFRVIGSNSDNVWNMEGLTIKVIVHPPFYQTYWFRMALILLIAGAFYAWYRARIISIQSQKVKLEHQVNERTHELEIKTESLEKINSIVKSINSELNFTNLLQSLLGEISVLKGVQFSMALVLERDLRRFTVRAVSGIKTEILTQLKPDELQNNLIRDAEVLYEDIYKQTGSKNQLEIFNKEGFPPAVTVTIPMLVATNIEGYLIFGNWTEPDAFSSADIEFLENLKEHILTAFIKTRLMEELSFLNEKKNEFLGIAAHDLRNPLTVIMNYVTLVIQQINSGQIDKEKSVRDLEKVLTVTQQMSRMITAFLDITAIESGKLVLNIRQDSILDILKESENFYLRLASQKGIQISYSLEESEDTEMIDRDRISEVIDNLVSNAIKYTQPGGEIKIRFSSTSREVVVQVEDNGQGLSEADLRDIFKSYKKLSARPTGGESSTGLGLAIVKKIIDMHHGKVWVESEKNKGAIFSFSIPRIWSQPF
ncbi:MAG: hypothetical protein J0L62_12850 [Bacteroidetes bacterium]|nr:hypothetical protein [Bacteroidota bacterium]